MNHDQDSTSIKQLPNWWPIIVGIVTFFSSLWLAPQLVAKDIASVKERVSSLEASNQKLADKMTELNIQLVEVSTQLKISNQLLQGIKR